MVLAQYLVQEDGDGEGDGEEETHQQQHKRREVVANGQTKPSADSLRDDPNTCRQ